ncbi:putative tRNA N6-adenosine threonylcarbamoyltransferase, mitochondrial [Araneus ventricosus]|uniref:N(6)-L-threonylcarbamoyladenine synthase n=1 Tax=Araneus ventricosus TaxID=182803 RepID=A0A4Y2MPJ3_ARAVE|nr:putative tRNA N6-adenosine threonylcarbamoyltransferase, mitochondrial [Araneus ventricosus]
MPVHHVEAHAMTAPLLHEIPFPFLYLLASGGHCELTLVKGVNEFLLLGDSMHNSPGEVLDKIARRLKLQNLPECYEMSGGKAIDYMARGGDPTAFNFPLYDALQGLQLLILWFCFIFDDHHSKRRRKEWYEPLFSLCSF